MRKFLSGVALLAICAIYIIVARAGSTIEDRDITAVIFFAPIGFYNCYSALKTLYINGRKSYERTH